MLARTIDTGASVIWDAKNLGVNISTLGLFKIPTMISEAVGSVGLLGGIALLATAGFYYATETAAVSAAAGAAAGGAILATPMATILGAIGITTAVPAAIATAPVLGVCAAVFAVAWAGKKILTALDSGVHIATGTPGAMRY